MCHVIRLRRSRDRSDAMRGTPRDGASSRGRVIVSSLVRLQSRDVASLVTCVSAVVPGQFALCRRRHVTASATDAVVQSPSRASTLAGGDIVGG